MLTVNTIVLLLLHQSSDDLFHPQGFNGADMRNVCTEAGMFAIRAERDYVIHEDFMKVFLSFFQNFCW